ncbi:unnamed protein product [Onchocerca flexuosa]|uniref:Kinesin motor domain-containing protein n=1 Tax=Onchocerca flexuosa TaxID=387005 RepID=A0A183HMK3_9BILA|nr:unnamed protein product [Onchocerca flexuosa]
MPLFGPKKVLIPDCCCRIRWRLMEEPEVDNVRVVVRCRPLSHAEHEQGYQTIVSVDSANNSISVTNPNNDQVA